MPPGLSADASVPYSWRGRSPRRSRRRPMRDSVIEMVVNGEPVRALVDVRKTLADFIREDCRLTGTHLGCEHGVCGACTVLLDGTAVRSCLLFAVQCDGAQVRTVEGLAAADGSLHPLQEAFSAEHA